ncbi:MAG: type II toxin-antitoxin system HicB family antitoxin [Clostridia bacterium]|nr:type II toxin-antitoxin system HicB family antitoxin [Clostridia bacterium]
MNSNFDYKGYLGSVEADIEGGFLYGKILFINDLVTYEADNLPELKKAFEEAVDDYLEFCEKYNKTPEKTCKGSFNVRISPADHRLAVMHARKRNMSLNQFVEIAIKNEINNPQERNQTREISQKLDVLSASVQSLNSNYAVGNIFDLFKQYKEEQ